MREQLCRNIEVADFGVGVGLKRFIDKHTGLKHHVMFARVFLMFLISKHL